MDKLVNTNISLRTHFQRKCYISNQIKFCTFIFLKLFFYDSTLHLYFPK